MLSARMERTRRLEGGRGSPQHPGGGKALPGLSLWPRPSVLASPSQWVAGFAARSVRLRPCRHRNEQTRSPTLFTQRPLAERRLPSFRGIALGGRQFMTISRHSGSFSFGRTGWLISHGKAFSHSRAPPPHLPTWPCGSHRGPSPISGFFSPERAVTSHFSVTRRWGPAKGA